MPAEVETYVGREAAWHRLGIVKGESMTVDAALTEGKMREWAVRTAPLVTLTGLTEFPEDGLTAAATKGIIESGDLGLQQIEEHRAIIRNNPFAAGVIDVLGVAGAGYTPIQNEAAFGFAEAVLDAYGDAVVDTVVSMSGGRQVAMCLRMPEGVTIGASDHHDLMLAICTSHDGTMALHAFPTWVRIVCKNTFRMALHAAERGGQTYKIRHTASAEKNVAAARAAMGVTFESSIEFKAMADEMLSTKMSPRSFDTLVARHFAVVSSADTDRVQDYRRRDQRDLRHLFTKDDTTEYGRGTRWGAFNAIQGWGEWVRPRGDATNEANSRSAIFGTTADITQKAWSLLTV